MSDKFYQTFLCRFLLFAHKFFFVFFSYIFESIDKKESQWKN